MDYSQDGGWIYSELNSEDLHFVCNIKWQNEHVISDT